MESMPGMEIAAPEQQTNFAPASWARGEICCLVVLLGEALAVVYVIGTIVLQGLGM